MFQKKERLAFLKKRLQQKLRAKAFFEEKIAPCIEIFTGLGDTRITFDIVGWIGIEEEWLSYPDNEWQQLPYKFDMESSNKSTRLPNRLFEKYPSVNSLRYVPPFEKINVNKPQNSGLKKGIEQLKPEGGDVYVYFLRYAPLLKLNLYDLLRLDEDTVFNFWHGDAVIFPENLNWLIAFSVEEEWYAGRSDDIKSISL